MASPAKNSDALGPVYDTSYVARWLWKDATGVVHFADGGRVLALRTKQDQLLYPAWQFRALGMAVPHLPEVIQILSVSAATPWTVAAWLNAPSDTTGGVGAATWLDGGGDPEPVVVAARDDASRWAR